MGDISDIERYGCHPLDQASQSIHDSVHLDDDPNANPDDFSDGRSEEYPPDCPNIVVSQRTIDDEYSDTYENDGNDGSDERANKGEGDATLVVPTSSPAGFASSQSEDNWDDMGPFIGLSAEEPKEFNHEEEWLDREAEALAAEVAAAKGEQFSTSNATPQDIEATCDIRRVKGQGEHEEIPKLVKTNSQIMKEQMREMRLKKGFEIAAMRTKLSKGLGEVYTFRSIIAGLRRKDFINTLEWSPLNTIKNDKYTKSPKIADVVEEVVESQKIIMSGAASTGNASPMSAAGASASAGRQMAPSLQSPSAAAAKAAATAPTAGVVNRRGLTIDLPPSASNRSPYSNSSVDSADSSGSSPHRRHQSFGGTNTSTPTGIQRGEGYMSEDDWQRAVIPAASVHKRPTAADALPKYSRASAQRRKSVLRSSQLDLNSFIGSALKEEKEEGGRGQNSSNTENSNRSPSGVVQQEPALEIASALSLHDLQSTSLIDARFGWADTNEKEVHHGWKKLRQAVGIVKTKYNPFFASAMLSKKQNRGGSGSQKDSSAFGSTMSRKSSMKGSPYASPSISRSGSAQRVSSSAVPRFEFPAGGSGSTSVDEHDEEEDQEQEREQKHGIVKDSSQKLLPGETIGFEEAEEEEEEEVDVGNGTHHHNDPINNETTNDDRVGSTVGKGRPVTATINTSTQASTGVTLVSSKSDNKGDDPSQLTKRPYSAPATGSNSINARVSNSSKPVLKCESTLAPINDLVSILREQRSVSLQMLSSADQRVIQNPEEQTLIREPLQICNSEYNNERNDNNGSTANAQMHPPEFMNHIGSSSSSMATSSMDHQSVLSPLVRPRSGGYRFVDRSEIEIQNDRDQQIIEDEEEEMVDIDAMESVNKEESENSVTKLQHDRKLVANYDGLMYKDPSQNRTWEGVFEMLSPPPVLQADLIKAQGADEKAKAKMDAILSGERSDMRWAGKTMNSYRPWSSPIRIGSSAKSTSNNNNTTNSSELELEQGFQERNSATSAATCISRGNHEQEQQQQQQQQHNNNDDDEDAHRHGNHHHHHHHHHSNSGTSSGASTPKNHHRHHRHYHHHHHHHHHHGHLHGNHNRQQVRAQSAGAREAAEGASFLGHNDDNDSGHNYINNNDNRQHHHNRNSPGARPATATGAMNPTTAHKQTASTATNGTAAAVTTTTAVSVLTTTTSAIEVRTESREVQQELTQTTVASISNSAHPNSNNDYRRHRENNEADDPAGSSHVDEMEYDNSGSALSSVSNSRVLSRSNSNDSRSRVRAASTGSDTHSHIHNDSHTRNKGHMNSQNSTDKTAAMRQGIDTAGRPPLPATTPSNSSGSNILKKVNNSNPNNNTNTRRMKPPSSAQSSASGTAAAAAAVGAKTKSHRYNYYKKITNTTTKSNNYNNGNDNNNNKREKPQHVKRKPILINLLTPLRPLGPGKQTVVPVS